jgi:hypothetical protein
MHQSETARFWRKLAAGVAAYAIALQAALSGLGLATLTASASAPALPICSEHAADPADRPSLPANDPWLCPCAATCMTTGSSVLSDAPAIAALPSGVVLPAVLSRCGSAAVPRLTARGPQIPRAPPTI